jgi:hypothetical protein
MRSWVENEVMQAADVLTSRGHRRVPSKSLFEQSGGHLHRMDQTSSRAEGPDDVESMSQACSRLQLQKHSALPVETSMIVSFSIT